MIRLLIFVAAVAAAPAQQIENPLGSSPEVVAAGHSAYNQNCTVCHGLDGAAGDRAPALAAERRYNRTTDHDLFDAVKNGIPATEMPGMGLADDDAWRIVAYIRSLRASAADFPPEGDAAAGEQVYRAAGGCDACHMINGRGGLIGPDLTNIGAEASLRRIRAALTVAKPHPPDGFEPVSVRTKGGRSIRGVVKNENNFSLQILGVDDRLHLLAVDEIESIHRDDLSLMPTDYDQRLSDEEFRDLVAYLSRLVR